MDEGVVGEGCENGVELLGWSYVAEGTWVLGRRVQD